MKKKQVLIILLWSTSALSQAEDTRTDYSLITGISNSTLIDPQRPDPVIVGGIPLAWRMTLSHNSTLSSIYQLGTLLDFGNNQFVRYGGETGFSWHFLGGARHIKKISSIAAINGNSPYNVSIPFRISYSQFSISSPVDHLDQVRGSTIEFKSGAEFHMDVFNNITLGTEFLFAFVSFPASVERLKNTGYDINILWRTEF